jgi:DNA primase
VASDLLRADTLPFSFTRSDGMDELKAREDLNEAIAVMVAQPVVDAALAEATLALSRDGSEEAFARQVALSRQRRELQARLANLMLADDEDFDD